MAEASPTPEYKCLLCLKPYNQPRELPCNHTLCCSCLTSYIDKEYRTENGDRQYFPCPVCDTPISLLNVKSDVNSWGTLFPINNLFINPTAKTSHDQNCEACQRVGESKPSVVWCTGCTEMLCTECKCSHGRNKMTAKHRLIPIKDKGIFDTTVNENCQIHDGQSLDVYCLDHLSMCCHICVSVLHRSCNNIIPIDDVAKTCLTEKPSRGTAWENIKDEANKMLKDDEAKIALLNSKEKKVSAEMTQKIQLVKGKLDDLNTTFQSRLAGQFNATIQKLSDRITYVKMFCTNAENSNILMNRIDKQVMDRRRFIMREKTKHQLSGHYRRMDQTIKNQPNWFDMKLSIEAVVDDIMKLTSIAKVDVTPNISSTSHITNARIDASLATLMSTPSADSSSGSDIIGSLIKVPATVDV